MGMVTLELDLKDQQDAIRFGYQFLVTLENIFSEMLRTNSSLKEAKLGVGEKIEI